MSNEFPPSSPFLDHHIVDDPFNSVTVPSKQSSKKLIINSPFTKDSPSKSYEYPTPNPSSSTGAVRSSSPSRQQSVEFSERERERETTPVAINPSSTNEIINEHQVNYTIPNALKVKLIADRKTTLGRSSNADYFIKSKFASRVHLKLHYNPEFNELTVLCTGNNGVIIDFGTTYYGYIKEIADKTYRFEIINKNEVRNKEEEVHTELSVFKDEQIIVPYNDRLTLKIKDHVTALEIVYDESETEDELFVVRNHTFHSPEKEAFVKPTEAIVSSPMDVMESQPDSNLLISPIKSSLAVHDRTTNKSNEPLKSSASPEVTVAETEPVKTKAVEVKAAETKSVDTGIVESTTKAEAIEVKSVKPAEIKIKSVEAKANPVEIKAKTLESKPAIPFKISQPKTIVSKAQAIERAKSVEPESAKFNTSLKRSKSTEHKTPLQPKDDNSLNQQQSRRRKAEPGLSPQKKKVDLKLSSSISSSSSPTLTSTPILPSNSLTTTETIKRKYINPREKISNLKIEEVLSTISDLNSVKNVLTNHLAFSRLSQTPLKQLQTVSGLTSGLTRQQLRATLASISCVGVIYRHGKDAAGKPLEEEYYYDVEKDRDFERTQMVSSIKGSSGLRNCRKTHKQYFWKKPVTKK